MRGVKESSIIQHLREISSMFFGIYKEPINLGEIKGEEYGFIGRELFSPGLNFNHLLFTLSSRSFNEVEEIFTSMARKKDLTLDELSLRIILENKQELHDKLDKKSRKKMNLLFQTWESAYQTHPNSVGEQYAKLLNGSVKTEGEGEKLKSIETALQNVEIPDENDFFECESESGEISYVTINRFNGKFNSGGNKEKVFI